MTVNETTAKILQTFGTVETSETAKHCQMLDQFFDYLNVRSLEKHRKKTKQPFLKLYINENDEKFSWMTNSFFHNLMNEKKILKTDQVISFKMLDLKCVLVSKLIMAY